MSVFQLFSLFACLNVCLAVGIRNSLNASIFSLILDSLLYHIFAVINHSNLRTSLFLSISLSFSLSLSIFLSLTHTHIYIYISRGGVSVSISLYISRALLPPYLSLSHASLFISFSLALLPPYISLSLSLSSLYISRSSPSIYLSLSSSIYISLALSFIL